MAPHVYVLPVSGGYFPLQVAALQWMNGVRPAVVMGSSGGNIAAYLSAAGGWSPTGTLPLMDYMYSGLFIKSWWPFYLGYLPSVLRGYFKGSVYAANPKFLEIFTELLTQPEAKASLDATELWTGTYNTTANLTQLFCNKAEGTSLLRPEPALAPLLNMGAPVYAAGDVELIGKACFASAAVPAVFPAQIIGDSAYVDGGTSYSSPLTCLQSEVRTAMGSSFHMTYFSPYNLEAPTFKVCHENLFSPHQPPNCKPSTIVNNGLDASTQVLKSLMLQDRHNGINLVGPAHQLTYTESVLDYAQFQAFQAERAGWDRSFVEVYPMSQDNLFLLSFTPEDVRRVIASVTQVGVRCWRPSA